MARDYQDDPVELTISTETVSFIIDKAREFDVKVPPSEEDPGPTPADDGETEILEDQPDDPTEAELRQLINDLNDDEIVELIAMTWVGRGDYGPAEWQEAKALAADRNRDHAAAYLMGIPLLPDLLGEGLAELGHSYTPDETV